MRCIVPSHLTSISPKLSTLLLSIFLFISVLPAHAAGTTNFFARNFEFNVMRGLGNQRFTSPVSGVIAGFLRERNSRLSEETARKYARYVTEAGREFGVDPFLIAAIMVKESTAKWQAKSSRGAYGLMQVHWKAHKKSIRKAFGNIKTLEDLLKPQNNIRVGTYLFANHIRKHQDMDKALDRYLGAPRTSYKKTVLQYYTSMSSTYLQHHVLSQKPEKKQVREL